MQSGGIGCLDTGKLKIKSGRCKIKNIAGVVQWQYICFPSKGRGSDSLHPLILKSKRLEMKRFDLRPGKRGLETSRGESEVGALYFPQLAENTARPGLEPRGGGSRREVKAIPFTRSTIKTEPTLPRSTDFRKLD